VNILLKYLKALGSKEKITFKQLTLKTASLLAILAGRRLHTLHMLDTRTLDIVPGEGKIICHIAGLTKCRTPKSPNKEIVFRENADPELCPVNCIKQYLGRRNTLINEQAGPLFITYGRPHHFASKDSLARWVKEAMKMAGIDVDTFKPHNTRSASNTNALNSGILLKEVLKRGQWRNASTFFLYYYREVEEWLDEDEDEVKE